MTKTSQVLHNNTVFSLRNLRSHAHQEVVHILTRLQIESLERKDGWFSSSMKTVYYSSSTNVAECWIGSYSSFLSFQINKRIELIM